MNSSFFDSFVLFFLPKLKKWNTTLVSRLYSGCDWEKNAIRKLVADGRIAARQKGLESPDSSTGATEECPICFLYYSEVNMTTCCHASMCTECYLQVRPQKEKQSTCPFCNCDDFSVVKDKKNKQVPEACPSETSTSLSDSSGSRTTSSSNGTSKKKSAASVAPHTTPEAKTKTTGFGSELEKDERFKRMRKRSESFASSDGKSAPKKEQEIIQSIAMSAEERQRLEEEMKAQHHHPLMLRLDSEAQERRMENDRAYQNSSRGHQTSSRNNPHLSRRVRTARNWEQIASIFYQADEIDNMSSLESAIVHSRMHERAAEYRANNNSSNSNSNNNSNREQLDGFPLLRTLLTGQLDSNPESRSSSSGSGSGSTRSSSRRHRHPFSRSRNRGMGEVAMGAASLMMLGISEEEQMAMAIAASMQDQEEAHTPTSEIEDETNDENQETDQNNETDNSVSIGSVSIGSVSSSNSIEQGSPDGSDNSADSSEDPPSQDQEPPHLKEEGSGDEESTITELARVVTDSRSPDADTILNGIAA